MELTPDQYETIQRIAEEHSNKTFGYLTKNDLKNEIWIICLEKLDEYSSKRGKLEHFLRVSVKHRLINRFKDITKSVRSPCHRCSFYDPGNSPSDCGLYGDDRHLCKKWRNYQLSLQSRNSLLNSVADEKQEKTLDSKVHSKVIGRELREIIEEQLPDKYKKDFRDLLNGNKISKQRIKRLRKIIRGLLEKHDDKLLKDYHDTFGDDNANS